MPKIRLLEPADSEMTMSMRDTSTNAPSITFQPLRKYEPASRTRPLDSTLYIQHNVTLSYGRINRRRTQTKLI